MAPNLYLVFSKPPSGISESEYDAWYEHHARENIVSPGFLSARRYAITPARDAPVPFSHLALYEYEGEMSTWRTDLTKRIEEGGIVLPEWFGEIAFASWDCTPVSERAEPERAGGRR